MLRERATQRKFSRIAEELRCTGATAAHAKKYFLRMLGSTRGEGLWIDRLVRVEC